jgi:hypothetical protein
MDIRWHPWDKDAALRLALDSLVRDNWMDALRELMIIGVGVGRLEGEPGWSLERRDPGNNAPGYAGWPDGAVFRAFVDPEALSLPHGERFYGKEEFYKLVEVIVSGG